MSIAQTNKAFTVFCQLETVPAYEKELYKSMLEAAPRFKSLQGFISQEIFKCPEGKGYMSVIKWRSQADHEAATKDAELASCPVGAMIESGKVRFNMITNQPVYSS